MKTAPLLRLAADGTPEMLVADSLEAGAPRYEASAEAAAAWEKTKTMGSAMRKLTVVPITLREANDFVESFHRHNGRTVRDGGKWAIGAQYADQLVGVAIVGNPISATYMDGFTAEVLRGCVRPDAPRNCNSFLYGACWRVWRAMGGRRMVTYTLRDESGASLRGAGWKIVGEVRPTEDGWRKNDHLDRVWQPVMGQLKFRWEITEEAA